MILLYGNGSDLSDQKAKERRAICKFITQKTMLSLIDVAKERGAKDWVKAYWNTYYCQNKITTANGKMHTTYCKNRFCSYCCGVRKAELVGKYLPILQCWTEPYFVTLTVKSVPTKRLQAIIKGINRAFRLIKAKYYKRSIRGTGEKLIGLKTLECNFNPKPRTYNPHIHLLVPSKAAAELLIKEWLAIWTSKLTHRAAQNYRKVKDSEKDLIELIKYEAKIFTELDGKRSKGKKGTAKIYARALDNIYTAMKGLRIVERFGFNLPKNHKQEKGNSQLVDEHHIWTYHSKSRDWLNEEHESTLTAFDAPPQLAHLLELNIDSELE
jgi:plasmid rolling circle replication initiator protein Rep